MSALQEIKVPTLGESIVEATVAKWHKNVGDAVNADEILLDLETEKVALEVTASAAGVLSQINTPQGSKVVVGDILGLIDATATAVVAPPVIKEATKPAAAPVSAPAVQQKQTSSQQTERIPMSRLRQTVAERLKHAQNTAAILTTFNEVDMSVINDLRSQHKVSFEKKHGVKLGFMSFFVKACIQALKEVPIVNAEIDGEDILYKNYYDIGVAVSTLQGLVVPVVRNADSLSFAEIEKCVTDLGKKARDGKLTIADLTGGTFTISNGGIFGSLLSTPILNPPQSAILGMHKIQDRPVAINGRIEIRPMMYLAVSYDHRLIDGKDAVTFLTLIKECIENPARFLLDL